MYESLRKNVSDEAIIPHRKKVTYQDIRRILPDVTDKQAGQIIHLLEEIAGPAQEQASAPESEGVHG